MTPARRTRLAAAATILWMLAVAAPVWAAASMTVTSPSGSPPTFTSSAPITGKLKVEEQERLRQADFSLSRVPEGDRCATEIAEEQRTLMLNNAMEADFSLDVALPCNGDYELAAKVTYDKPLAAGVSLSEEVQDETFRFGVAIPPAAVKGLKATYEPEGKKVKLTWSPNSEPDIIGYRIERNPPGPDGFKPLAGTVADTTFTDTLDVDEEHRYRVVALRPGPGASEIAGEPSSLVTAGPDRPEPTVPDTTLLRPPPPAAAGRTGSGAKTNTGATAPQVRRGPVTTIDDGFGKTLPFDPSQTTSIPDAPAVPPEDAAVLAIDDARSDLDDRRATLIPIAGGLALLMAAVHMRLLSKRAAEPELGVYSRPQLR